MQHCRWPLVGSAAPAGQGEEQVAAETAPAEAGEQLPAAGRLPPEVRPQNVRIDGQPQQIIEYGKVTPTGLGDLIAPAQSNHIME